MDIEVDGLRKKESLKMELKKQIEEESVKVGLYMGDAVCRSKWIVGVDHIATRLR